MTPGQKLKSTVTGSTRKTTGTIIAISRRAATSTSSRRPASRTSAAWAWRTSASGVPRSTATAMPWAKRATSGRPVRGGQPVEGARDRLAGADLGEHPGQVGGELAAGAAYDPVEGGDRALAGGDGEGEELGDGRELGEDPALAALHLGGEVLVAGEHAGGERRRAEQQGEQHAAGLGERPQQAVRRGDGEADQPPDDLLDAELGHRHRQAGPVQAAAHGRRAAEHLLDRLGGTAEQRAEDAAGRAGGRRRPAGEPGQVADVGQHPGREPGPPGRGQAGDREQHAARQGGAQHGAPRSGRHRRIRRSTGSRPIRIIRR